MLYCLCVIGVISLVGLSDTFVNANTNAQQITTEDLLFSGTNNDSCSTQIEYINDKNETITLKNESMISNYLFQYSTSMASEALLIGSNPFEIDLCFSKIYPIEFCVVYVFPNNNFTTDMNNFEIYYTTEYDDVNTSLTKGELYVSASNCQGNYDDCSNVVFDSSVTNDDYYFIKELKFIGNIDDGNSNNNNNNNDEMLVNMQCYYSVTPAPTSSPTLSPTLSPTTSPTLSPTLSPTSVQTIIHAMMHYFPFKHHQISLLFDI